MDREWRKLESAMQKHGHIEEVMDMSMGPEMTPAGKSRLLGLEETKTHPPIPFMGALTVGLPQLNLRPVVVRAYVMQETEDGIVQG